MSVLRWVMGDGFFLLDDDNMLLAGSQAREPRSRWFNKPCSLDISLADIRSPCGFKL